MPPNRFRTGYVATPEDGASLQFAKASEKGFTVSYVPAKDAVQLASRLNEDFVPPAAPLLIIEATAEGDILVMHPLNTTATSRGFLEPKYEVLDTVTLEAFGVPDADNLQEVLSFLRSLPGSFVKDPFYGLGIIYDLRCLTGVIEGMDDVTDLRIVRGGSKDLPTLRGSSYVISASQLDNARKAVARIHNKALGVAAQQKLALAHNTLLTPIDSVKYPQKQAPYRRDAILEAIGDSLARNSTLSRADQTAVVAAAKSAARSVSRSTPSELLELTHEIEVVTLEGLIERIESRLEKNDDEAAWQAFFIDNPFILRIAFGLPVMMFGEQITVGGRRFSGGGDKISDFVVKAVASGNLSLIEIKTPKTALLEAREYRGNLYGPSRDLSGAVNQILDQRYQLQKTIATLKDASGVYDVESYAIQGLIVAGRTPTGSPKVKSFELFRNALKSVTVITFDELVEKLKHLLEVLHAPEGGAFSQVNSEASACRTKEDDVDYEEV